ncbi:hypothetical protein ACQ4PT_038013 [Festuca glaucescens]
MKGRRQPPAGLLHLTSRGTSHPGDAEPRGGRRGARHGGRGRRGTRRRGRRTPRGLVASGAVPQCKPAVDGGLSPQLLVLAAVNAGSGRHVRCWDTRGRRAWCARAWPTEMVLKSGCRPVLTSLSSEVLDVRWDMVVGDGPSVDQPEELVRMGAIYRVAALARVAARR